MPTGVSLEGGCMPTVKPRILVTLDQEHFDKIGRMAELSGMSKSALVRDMLQSFEPMLDTAIRLREAADAARERMVEIPPELDRQALRMERDAFDLLAGLEKAVMGTTEVTPVSVIRGSGMAPTPVKPRKGVPCAK